MTDTDDIPFHGAKLAILVGDAIVTLQRDDNPTIPWPGYWDLPGGAAEQGETPLDCVLRETFEELGVAIDPARICWRGCWPSAPSHIWLFVAEWPDFDPSTIRFGDEGQRFALAPIHWFLTRAKVVPSLKKRLNPIVLARHSLRSSVLSA